MGASRDVNDIDVYSYYREYGDRLCHQVKISTTVQAYPTYPGLFYADTDCYLMRCHDFSLVDANDVDTDNWVDLTPLRVVHQPYDLPMWALPMSAKDKSTSGLHSVVSVCMEELGIMYKYWSAENALRPSGEKHTIADFVSKHLIPGMLATQLDCVIRLNALGASHGCDHKYPRPFVMADKLPDIGKHVASVLKPLNESNIGPYEYLSAIPMVSGGEQRDVYPYVQVVQTHANYPILFAASIPLVNALLYRTMFNAELAVIHPELRRVTRSIRSNRLWDKYPDGLMADTLADKWFEIKNALEDF